MTQKNPIIKELEKVVSFPTTEEAFCAGEIVDYFELAKSINDHLIIPDRQICKGYVRNLAANIIKHGRVHMPISIKKLLSGKYIIADGVYRILALEQIRAKTPEISIEVKAKLSK